MSKTASVNKELLIEYLGYLADAEQQKKTWLNINNTENLVYSFSDNINDIFYGTGLEDALTSGEVVFDDKTDTVLRELSDAVDAMDINIAEEEMYFSSEMQRIRALSSSALQLIETV